MSLCFISFLRATESRINSNTLPKNLAIQVYTFFSFSIQTKFQIDKQCRLLLTRASFIPVCVLAIPSNVNYYIINFSSYNDIPSKTTMVASKSLFLS